MQHQSLWQQAPQPGQPQGPKSLITFKAGKCAFSNNMVTPDKRKGEISLRQSEDALMHFVWKDRTSGATEDDLIIFPQEAVFKRVPNCTDGYVYLLEFNTSARKIFYWSQEPRKKGAEYSKPEDNTKEDGIVEKLNNFLNNPPTPTQAGGPGGFGGFGGLTHNDLMAMLTGGAAAGRNAPGTPGGAQPSPAVPADTSAAATAAAPAAAQTPAATPSAPPTAAADTPSAPSRPATAPATGSQITAGDLASILSNIGVPQPGAQAQAQGMAGMPQAMITVADVVDPQRTDIMGVLDRHPELEQMLFEHLAPVEPTGSETIRETLNSPQFLPAVDQMTMALNSGMAHGLVQDMGLRPTFPGVDSFLQAVQAQADERAAAATATPASADTAPPDPKPDDDKMDTS